MQHDFYPVDPRALLKYRVTLTYRMYRIHQQVSLYCMHFMEVNFTLLLYDITYVTEAIIFCCGQISTTKMSKQ